MKHVFGILFLSIFFIGHTFGQLADTGDNTSDFLRNKDDINYLLRHGDINEIDKEILETYEKFLDNPFDSLDSIKINSVKKIISTITFYEEGEGEGEGEGESVYENLTSEQKQIQLEDNKLQENKLEQQQIKLISNNASIIPSGVSFSGQAIDALSKHLVNRVKQELAITFYENFEKHLKNEIEFVLKDNVKIKLKLDAVFPNSSLLLKSKKTLTIPSFGQTWINAFKKDLSNLPFATVKELYKNNGFKTHKTGRFVSVLADAIEGLEKGKHPIEVFSSLSEKYNSDNDTDKHITFLNFISQTFTKHDNGEKKWLSIAELDDLSEEIKVQRIGLIYQKGRELGLLKNLKQTPTEDNYIIFYKSIRNVLSKINNIKKNLSDLSTVNEEEKFKTYISYIKSVFQTINTTYESILKLNDNNNKTQKIVYDSYIPLGNDIISFMESLSNKDYGGSLLATISLISHLSDGKDDELLQKISFYGNFLTDIIYAAENKNTKIEDIIANYAAPINSYRLKRVNSYSLDINAYPGLYFGYELGDLFNSGITAPIGVSFSRSRNKMGNYNVSNSLFISVIDIGAPFKYRWKNSKEGLPEDIKWEQVFAPGISYVYGFKNSPLAIMGGVQASPLLMGIGEKNQYRDKSTIGFNIALTVDIPIFNLKTVEHKFDKKKNE